MVMTKSADFLFTGGRDAFFHAVYQAAQSHYIQPSTQLRD